MQRKIIASNANVKLKILVSSINNIFNNIYREIFCKFVYSVYFFQ